MEVEAGAGKAVEWLVAIVESSDEAIIGKTLDGTILSWNRAAERIYGYRAEQTIGRSLAMLLPPDREGELAEILARVRRGERVHQFETRLIRKDGREIDVSLTVSPIRDPAGEIVGASTIVRDVSERRRAETALRQSEARTRAILNAALDAVISIDRTGAVIEFNPAAERTFGRSRDEVVGRQMAELFIPPRLRSAHYEGLERFLRTGAGPILGHRVELSALRAGGTEFPVELAIVALEVEGAPVFTGYLRDISDRVRSEEALRRSEESYRQLFAHHPAPMWVYAPDTHRFLAVNDAAIAAYGFSRDEFLAMTIEQIRPDAGRRALEQAIGDAERGYVDAGVWRHRKLDGTLIDVAIVANDVEFEGKPARLVLATDVTERRRLEEQLRQSQRMEAIGGLAGGVAHDFNNVLMAIGARAALLARTANEEQERDVAQIEAAVQRGTSLTRQLLAFSRQQVIHPEVTDLNEVVLETLDLLEKVIGEDVETVFDRDGSLPPILVDRGQLGQVILNLAVNARDAMPEGGSLTIRTASAELEETSSFGHVGVEPGPYALLEVTDSGEGMDEETRARAFEPFFTTKETGTGLGLATVYGIVRQTGGHVSLDSEPGLGTTFRLYFPLA